MSVAYRDDQQQHVALPKLYGAPAYARPAAPVAHNPRPFDPDDLPIDANQTDEERRWVETLPARAYAAGGGVMLGSLDNSPSGQGPMLRPRPFLLRALAGRILRSE
jgi:hypothetical protein